MHSIYLDNNATTQPLPEVVEEVARISRMAYGNPGSRHAAGRVARQVLESARERIAAILDASPKEVVFTSGGTESINLALNGLAKGASGYVVTLPGEHPATSQTLKTLSLHPIEIPLDVSGRLVQGRLAEIPWTDVRLASALLAHNETGVIQDLSRLASHCLQYGIPLHVDAVQAVGKIDVSFRQLGAAALSLTAHKFHGPHGIGALLLRSGVGLVPGLHGGHQERDLRPGTEAVALASGMALALERWHGERATRTSLIAMLRDRLEQGLHERCAPVVVNGAEAPRLPNTLSIAFPGCDADALLVALDLERVCVSLGSACVSGSTEPAPILVAMGAPDDVVRTTLRLSLSILTTTQEIDEAIDRIGMTVKRLRGSIES